MKWYLMKLNMSETKRCKQTYLAIAIPLLFTSNYSLNFDRRIHLVGLPEFLGLAECLDLPSRFSTRGYSGRNLLAFAGTLY